jgi:hypothetical protein
MLGVRPCPAHLHAYHGGTIGLLSLVLVLAADNLVAVADEVTDVGTLEELDAVGHRGGAQFPGMLGVRPCPAHLHAYHGGTIGQA